MHSNSRPRKAWHARILCTSLALSLCTSCIDRSEFPAALTNCQSMQQWDHKSAITGSRLPGESGRAASAVLFGRRLNDGLPGVTLESKSRTKPCMTGKGTCIFSVCYFCAEWKNLDQLLFR
jgi:hypothetical protein